MNLITVGVFDGVHVGHAYMIKKMIDCAKRSGLNPVAMIFEKPFEAIKKPQNFDGLLTTPEERIRILEDLGIKDVIVKDLNDISNIEMMEFINFLTGALQMKMACVGHDFRFGRGAEGNAEILKEIGKHRGFDVEVIPKILRDERRVSSTVIRRELKEGRPDIAARYLGRKFAIYGTVFKERGIGSKMGFPTANVRRKGDLLIPKYGVYLVRSEIGPETLYGVMNIGLRPTTDDDGPVTYEVHFLDRRLNLLGSELRIELIDYMRPEVKFPDIRTMGDAITKDIENARDLIERLRRSGDG